MQAYWLHSLQFFSLIIYTPMKVHVGILYSIWDIYRPENLHHTKTTKGNNSYFRKGRVIDLIIFKTPMKFQVEFLDSFWDISLKSLWQTDWQRDNTKTLEEVISLRSTFVIKKSDYVWIEQYCSAKDFSSDKN